MCNIYDSLFPLIRQQFCGSKERKRTQADSLDHFFAEGKGKVNLSNSQIMYEGYCAKVCPFVVDRSFLCSPLYIQMEVKRRV